MIENVHGFHVQIYNTSGNPWDSPLTGNHQLSSPLYMERPPVNTTWKDVYISMEDLDFARVGNVAAFGLFHDFPGYFNVYIAEIAFTNASFEVVPLQPNEEICYSPNHCEMTQDASNIVVPPTSTSGVTTASTSGGSSGNNNDEDSVSSALKLIYSAVLLLACTLFAL